MTRADLDKQPGDVAAMFDGIAERYDLLNDILSAGQVRLWRRAVARIIGAGPGDRVLDLAAGTGTSALSFTATGADCVACDFSLGMLRAGQSRLAGREQRGAGRLGWVAGDALRLWWDLSRYGVEAKFLYFPDENHWILTPGNARIWYETVFAFLAQH
ncbi:MAG TPA: class I SAM-dependent methyltransferase, partial [Streptosporangiaceae bacterium]|nr:class I SAM-dependent methyltransferase [Streptosporangiaceae bacterium]